ncbi:TraV family lipoprotein [Rhodoferax sp.]|uniref:TraV family lipoprotein n=1 Tax=Rhodoferax sp. TaxID=50421 RepID=UPI00275F23AE|nr:TraV family lipoprotein [Rhodoferax sp.]
MRYLTITILAASTTLGACGSLSGLPDATGSFGCKAPDGVTCSSVSGVYANARKNNLPGQRSKTEGVVPPTRAEATPHTPTALPVALPGMPIRSQARTVRIWVAPWVDSEGDLNDQTFVYVTTEQGKWLMEHSREATVRKVFTKLRPASVKSSATASAVTATMPTANEDAETLAKQSTQ